MNVENLVTLPKAMISQPMGGKSGEEILLQRNRAIEKLNYLGYDVVDTWFNDDWAADHMDEGVKNKALFYLAKSLEEMSKVDLVYFCKGYEDARGCRIEHQAAMDYGLDIMYDE